MNAAEKACDPISAVFPSQSASTYRYGVEDILGKEHTLEFDEEKVKKLLEILQRCLESFSGDGEVFARAEGARKTLREEHLTGDLGSNRD